ncbi:MAG TPA: class I SAM-dependent methyltransferase, partial [Pirellulales bacterium]|nr:class I SAM-dependent methyltransferase [Pirellulales bacterium]
MSRHALPLKWCMAGDVASRVPWFHKAPSDGYWAAAVSHHMNTDTYYPAVFPVGAFIRDDSAPDALFYREPRLHRYLDADSAGRVEQFYASRLKPGGAVLDVMTGYESHMPLSLHLSRLVGLGMNDDELRLNSQLTGRVIQDLNVNYHLPFADGEFDGVVMCAAVLYLIRPVEVFREIVRVLRPGGFVIVTYFDQGFPSKAVRIWLALNDEARGYL